MNILVSYDWLKEYVKLKETPEEFAARVSLSGPGVEKIIPQGEGFEKIVLGHVKEVKAHPNADKLRVAMVDIGVKSLAQIVCGGSNLKADQWVVVALVGSKVRWHGEGDPVTLEPIELRGVKSEGMICAANEIGLFDAFPHAEREILDVGVALPEMIMKAGTPIADVLGLSSDVVLDIEVTTNRVDAAGVVGLAREAASILKKPFTWSPELGALNVKRSAIHVPRSVLSVRVSAKKQCPRYMAVRMDGVTVGPSPWWLKRRLMSAGIRPINNVVDVTNYVLLELAQPMHAFDAATLEQGIDVRLARAGETMKALDGKDYKLTDTMLVIADATRPVAIAGVMGGEASGVSNGTTSIILESATFDPVSIRRTSRALNLQSDSQSRYEKGLSTEALPIALARAVELIRDVAGGHVASSVADVQSLKTKPVRYTITMPEITALIGVPIPTKDIVDILRRLGFKVTTSGKRLTATVPWWRDHDIESSRDLVEEVARIFGYGNIPPVVPVGLAPRPVDGMLTLEDRLKDLAKGSGCIETISYSFVSADMLKKAGYDASKMLRIQNPLTADMEFMRTTLLPSLLQTAAENQERRSSLKLFEIANVYYPKSGDLPDEQPELGALFMGADEPWRAAKGFVEHLLHENGIDRVSWRRLSSDSFWHPGRTVQAFVKEELVATVGEVMPTIAAAFKLEQRIALVDMPLMNLVRHATMVKQYTPLPPFPPAKRDLAVLVDARVEYDDIAREIRRVSSLVTSVEWFDTYIGKNLPSGKKSLAMHLEFSSLEKTLENREVDAEMEKIQLGLKEKFTAEIRV